MTQLSEKEHNAQMADMQSFDGQMRRHHPRRTHSTVSEHLGVCKAGSPLIGATVVVSNVRRRHEAKVYYRRGDSLGC